MARRGKALLYMVDGIILGGYLAAKNGSQTRRILRNAELVMDMLADILDDLTVLDGPTAA